MKASTPALLLYIVSGFLFFLSTIIDNEYLTLIAKPIISTSIFFYYWQESHGKVNFWFSSIIILFFASGIFTLFEDEFALQYVILINFVAYCILLAFIIRSLFELRIKSINNYNLAYIIFMLLFLSSLLYMCLFLVFDSTSDLFIIVYTVILLIIGVLTVLLYSLKNTRENIYLMMTIFCFIICDLFDVIYYYDYDFIFFRYVSILCNIVSFYFLVNYFLLKKENRENDEVY